jgi:hypothetical protein
VEADPGAALEPAALGTGAAVADIDGDGVLELLVAHGESAPQPLSLYKVTGASARPWLRVAPLTASGAPARGALVEVTASGGRTSVHNVDAGSGYLCQMEPVAHIGLGADHDVETTVAQVTVRWPGGARTTVAHPEVGRVLVVPHPDPAPGQA